MCNETWALSSKIASPQSKMAIAIAATLTITQVAMKSNLFCPHMDMILEEAQSPLLIMTSS